MNSKRVIETERLYLREMTPDDAEEAYQLNADPKVIQYTGDDAFDSIDAAKQFLINYQSYRLYGFGRWAVIRKSDEAFLGWCGIKYSPEIDEYDIGYRFHHRFWNNGYAYESAAACLEFGFTQLNIQTIVGRVMKDNKASIRVLEKLNLKFVHEEECGKEEGLIYQLHQSDYIHVKHKSR